MNEQHGGDTYSSSPALVEALASEVAAVLSKRLSAKEVLRLFHCVFLNVEEAAELLRVKPKTISTWISHKEETGIPVRYAGASPRFLLAELLLWTLPDNDHATQHRLTIGSSSTIAANRLATNRERRFSDAG